MSRALFKLDGTDDPLRFSWVPSPLLLAPALTLQGGAGLGAATAAMERVTGRPVIWATAQYLSFAAGTAAVDIEVDDRGRRPQHHPSPVRDVARTLRPELDSIVSSNTKSEPRRVQSRS